ncbi:MAG: alpha/beta hydrolase [Flavisolibacter sp.]
MKVILLTTALLFQLFSVSQKIIPLYPANIPNSKPSENREHEEQEDNTIIAYNITVPTLTVFEPVANKRTGDAIVICPGGGYGVEAVGHEGYDVAKRLNESGITCFVLKYRLPNDSTMIDKSIGPLQDAQRAIQYVRENGSEWHIKKNMIGIMGFSAGGHLVSTEGTHFKKALIPNPLGTSLRPDFMILVYPVINFSDSLAHIGSRENLIGKNPSQRMIRLYSNDLQINKETPPTFLVHAINDDAVNVRNSIRFYEAVHKYKPQSEIYLYDKGGHGFGMINPTSDIKWIDLVITWMRKNKF